MTAPIPVLGWDADRPTWLSARRPGIGASDVAAILGFSGYASPWKVWAEKTGAFPTADFDTPSQASELGSELEPFLIGKAADLLGTPVVRTAHQLYAHPADPWRMCSPDAVTADGTVGVQLKTAGLASGHGPPKGWDDDQTPLGYELQCRWERLVMGWERVELIALVANRGILRRTVTADDQADADLLAQVGAWRQRHICDGVEPAMSSSDNALLGVLYPAATAGETVELPADEAITAWSGYRMAQAAEAAAKREKEACGAVLKRLLGTAEFGEVDGRVLAVWSAKKKPVNWQRMAEDLAARAGVTLPDPETYRGKPGRSLNVKDG